MSKVVVFIQALVWAALAYLGVTHLSPELQAIVTIGITQIAGFISPALIEWQTRHRNLLATLATVGSSVVVYLLAHVHGDQRLPGLVVAVMVAAVHLLVPSTAHPSRLAEPQ